MQRLKNFASLLSSDLYKLMRMKSVYIGIGVMIFLTLIIALAQNALTDLLNSLPEDGSPLDPSEVDAVTGTFLFTMLNGAPSSTGVFFLMPIIAALFIGSDFSSGMTRLFVGRGVSKTELYISKYITLSLLSVIYVCLSFAMCAVAAKASEVSEEALSSLFSYTASAFGAQIFLAFTLAAIYTAVCFSMRSKAASMATLIAMLIILGDVLVMVVQISLAMLTTGTDVTGKFVYMLFDPYYCADAFASASVFTQQEAGIAYGGCAMWLVLFFFGGLFLNAERDVK